MAKPYFGIFVLAMALAGCTATQSPPTIDFDPAEFDQAILEPQPPKPIRYVEIPTPLPLPGQLKPLPYAPKRKPANAQSPKEQIASAQKAAKVEPSTDGYVNAIQVYPFTEGALYQLYTAPEQVSDIALQAGETIVAVSAGDTLRWVVGIRSAGVVPRPVPMSWSSLLKKI